jgi:hypothetical protein
LRFLARSLRRLHWSAMFNKHGLMDTLHLPNSMIDNEHTSEGLDILPLSQNHHRFIYSRLSQNTRRFSPGRLAPPTTKLGHPSTHPETALLLRHPLSLLYFNPTRTSAAETELPIDVLRASGSFTSCVVLRACIPTTNKSRRRE